MTNTISVNEKKDFIRWFLNHYELKRRESVWILSYLISHEEMIKNIHFVDNVINCDRGLIMSTHCVDEIPFRFYKSGAMTTDPEKAFHDIRRNRDKALYIQLDFRSSSSSSQFARVLEDNPFYTETEVKDGKYGMAAEEILDNSLNAFKKEIIMKKIDEALDSRDRVAFMDLTEELSNL